MSTKTILIVGAGAAGLMAAIHAAGRGARVVLIESTTDGGRKILISGGGRCNVLPEALEPDRFVSESSRPIVRRFLRSWPLIQQREFFERDLRIPLVLEEESRKYFPASNRARDVRDALIALARTRGVELQFSTPLRELSRTGTSWTASTLKGPISANAVILATGGRSVPTTGSDGTGLDLAQRLGHTVHATYPALTPLTCDLLSHMALSGVSVTARLRASWRDQVTEAEGGFLFTHRGYSGPAVLDVSHVAVRSRLAGERASIRVRWSALNASDWNNRLSMAAGQVSSILSKQLPARLADQILSESGIPLERRAAELRREERTTLIEKLTSYELPWAGDEGYKKAEVTGGGVALEEVDHKTMASRVQPGLFLCGEILDAFGPIGGHNFAWAWATGRLAGQSAIS